MNAIQQFLQAYGAKNIPEDVFDTDDETAMPSPKPVGEYDSDTGLIDPTDSNSVGDGVSMVITPISSYDDMMVPTDQNLLPGSNTYQRIKSTHSYSDYGEEKLRDVPAPFPKEDGNEDC